MWDPSGNGDGGMGEEMEGVVEMEGCVVERGSWPSFLGWALPQPIPAIS